MTKKEKNNYIEIIFKYKDIIGELKEENYDYFSISEYDSVYQDILDYEDDGFYNWRKKDFEEFIEYLGDLTNTKINLEN